MVNHSFDHSLDNWKHMDMVLSDLIRIRGMDHILGHDETYQKKLLYSLLMAIWLHDIGHKGADLYGEPHLIRDNHGYISGLLILRYPHLFRILDEDDFYRDLPFKEFSAIEAIYFRRKEGLSVTEGIALFSMYHKSNTPMDDIDYMNIQRKNKLIPREFYIGGIRSISNVITLQKLLKERNLSDEEIDKFLNLLALFRFIDAIDIGELRVGDETEKMLKTSVIENDKRYMYAKMEREIKMLCKDYEGLERPLLLKSLYEDVKEKIERGEQVELHFPEGVSLEEIENYKMITDYASYVALQTTHFSLHESIKRIDLKIRGNSLEIELFTDKTKEKLENEEVLERGRKKQNVYERLVGKDCYIKSEVEGVKHRLRNFFASIKVTLKYEEEVIGQQTMVLR